MFVYTQIFPDFKGVMVFNATFKNISEFSIINQIYAH
jgi:hypothetical protein